jgi:hypothetical protein
MFLGGDVDGVAHGAVCGSLGIQICPGLDRTVEKELRWALRSIEEDAE